MATDLTTDLRVGDLRAEQGGNRGRAGVVVRSASTLRLLAAALPVNLLLIGYALLRSTPRPRVDAVRAGLRGEQKTILVSGGRKTKALHLARAFHRAGHWVILVEEEKYALTGHGFSRSVHRFRTLPPVRDPDYPDALRQLVEQEQVDVYSPVSAWYDAVVKDFLEPACEVFHVSRDDITRLDDKYEFADTATALGLRVPETFRITHPQQVVEHQFAADGRTWVLKCIAYDPVRRLDLTQLPMATPSRRRRSRGRYRSRKATHGSCRSSSGARSTAHTARSATGLSGCTAAVTPRPPSSTTPPAASPTSRRGSDGSCTPCT